MRRTEYRGPLRKKLEDTARWVVFDLMTDSGPHTGQSSKLFLEAADGNAQSLRYLAGAVVDILLPAA